jgi:hypothetical protein
VNGGGGKNGSFLTKFNVAIPIDFIAEQKGMGACASCTSGKVAEQVVNPLPVKAEDIEDHELMGDLEVIFEIFDNDKDGYLN